LLFSSEEELTDNADGKTEVSTCTNTTDACTAKLDDNNDDDDDDNSDEGDGN